MVFDLHIHSTASDGQLTPTEVVQHAHAHHIDMIALSDHDTAAGVAEAQKVGNELGVHVIAAIELSAAFSGELHVLGYRMNIEHPAFVQFLDEQQCFRRERNQKMIASMQHHGFAVTEDDCRTLAIGAGENWGRSHMARVLIEKGYCTSVKEAFDRWLGYGKICYVAREKLQPEKCMQLIHACGGFAVLAHPGLVDIAEHQRFSFIKGLKEKGLDGIEAYYPQHSRQDAAQFVRYARQLGLYISYGSDFHGSFRSGNEMLAGWTMHNPQRETEPFLKRLMEG